MTRRMGLERNSIMGPSSKAILGTIRRMGVEL